MIPAQDLDTERAALGAMMLAPEALAVGVDGLSPASFMGSGHAVLFSTLVAMHRENKKVDLVTMRDALTHAGKLETVGGVDTLTELAESVPDPGNIGEYVRILEDCRQRRALILAGHELQRAASECGADPVALASAYKTRLEAAGGNGQLPAETQSTAWPELPDEAAYHGLAGEITRTIEPHTESDPAALLIQTLTAFGNTIGRGPHFMADGARHTCNLFGVLVGETSKGRKGTSWQRVCSLFAAVDEAWATDRVKSGLSSGEGLIWAIRDPIHRTEQIKEKGRVTGETQEILIDAGVEDKRLLVLESEFASVLRVLGRDGNTLSATIRQAWDTGTLRTLTKNCPAQATGAHISTIGHVTKDELLRYMDRTEQANGLGNRFLWACVQRSKCLPDGGGCIDDVELGRLQNRLAKAITFGSVERELLRDEQARAVWHKVYPELSKGRPGLSGSMVGRAEAQVMRLAMLYALLDLSDTIRLEHLKAALALWEYCEASVQYIFGVAIGDSVADRIVQALTSSPDGMTRSEINKLLRGHTPATRITQTLEKLVNLGQAHCKREDTGGRPSERWFLGELCAK